MHLFKFLHFLFSFFPFYTYRIFSQTTEYFFSFHSTPLVLLLDLAFILLCEALFFHWSSNLLTIFHNFYYFPFTSFLYAHVLYPISQNSPINQLSGLLLTHFALMFPFSTFRCLFSLQQNFNSTFPFLVFQFFLISLLHCILVFYNLFIWIFLVYYFIVDLWKFKSSFLILPLNQFLHFLDTLLESSSSWQD